MKCPVKKFCATKTGNQTGNCLNPDPGDARHRDHPYIAKNDDALKVAGTKAARMVGADAGTTYLKAGNVTPRTVNSGGVTTASV